MSALDEVKKLALQAMAKPIELRIPPDLWQRAYEELGRVPAIHPDTGERVIVNQRFGAVGVDEPNFRVLNCTIMMEQRTR